MTARNLIERALTDDVIRNIFTAAIDAGMRGYDIWREGIIAALAADRDALGVQPCCGEYATCDRPCTPRGKWLAQRESKDALPGLREAALDETIKERT